METLNAPSHVSTPSIASSAMLVELSISTWTGRKLDKRASSQVTATHGAASGVANVNKKLLGDCDELTAVQKFTANVRNLHYGMTMPWSDTGLRLLPTAQYFKYNEAMTAVQDEYRRMVDNFLRAYDWEISQAQAKLGELFNHADYPTAESIGRKFSFRFSYIPLPEAGDFRVDVGNEATAQITQHYKSYYTSQLESAMRDVWQRTYTALSKMSERLDYADDTHKKVFRDSLVSNVLDMVELLDVCNVTGDSQMAALRAKLDDTLRGVTPDALRDDVYLRAQTKRAVDAVIAQLPSLDV